MNNFLELKNISKHYGDQKALNEVTLTIDKGQITEQGTHAELMARGGIYKKLVDLQTFD